MIGLAGAHRTGKSSLAREYSKQSGIPFAETSTSAVFKKLGFDPKEDYNFKIRMMIQNKILDVAEELWRRCEGEFITDRTPIDMLAYTMADIQRENLDADDISIFNDYMNRCIASANRHFAMVMIVQPGIPLVYEEGKAPLNVAYIEHINSLVIGITTDQRVKIGKFFINRATTDMKKRCGIIDYALDKTYGGHTKEFINNGEKLH